jgi:ribosome modulation factor
MARNESCGISQSWLEPWREAMGDLAGVEDQCFCCR